METLSLSAGVPHRQTETSRARPASKRYDNFSTDMPAFYVLQRRGGFPERIGLLDDGPQLLRFA